MRRPRNHIDDLRAVGRLAVKATEGVTEVVEAMHLAIAGGPALLGQPLRGPVGLAISPVYGGIRAVTRLVGTTLDGALAALAPLVGEGVPGREREAARAVLNGVLGDYLSATDNPLAIQMHLHPAAVAGRRLLVMLHGSSMSHAYRTRDGHDHAASLARDLGFTAVHLEYNTGLHISTNGRAFAMQLEDLCSAWRDPIDEIVLIGHSMGGLVVRSACHVAERERLGWPGKLTRLITIGSPHHGSPVERGSWIHSMLGLSRFSAPLARLAMIRSAGVTDLRWGNVVDEHWVDRHRFAPGGDTRTPVPLPAGVASLAIAGTTAPKGSDGLPGDGLVPVASALGQHVLPEHELQFSHRFLAHATGHVALLSSRPVFDAMRAWLS